MGQRELSKEEQLAWDVVQAVAKAVSYPKKITDVIYREDYQDFQVIIEDDFHCEIREKLIKGFAETQDKDALKEIAFRLSHSTAFEEWEKPAAAGSGGREEDDRDVVIDDSDQYDF